MKKPIWERPTYIANRIVFQAKLKEEQAKPKPNGGSGQNTTTGNGGGSTSNNNVKPIVKPKCPEKDKNDTSVVTIIDCTKETANINNSIISNHGNIDVLVRRSTKTVGGGFDHFVKTNKINTNLKKVYNDQNNKDNGKLIIEAFGEVLSMFDKTELIGTVLSAVAGLDTEPSNGKFAIYYKAFYDMQIVYYAGLPMVYHQVKSLSAGIFDAGTEKSILSTIDKGKDKYVDVSYGIKNHSDDKTLIKFGSPYYMKRKGPYSNVYYYDFSEFAFKNKSYTAKV